MENCKSTYNINGYIDLEHKRKFEHVFLTLFYFDPPPNFFNLIENP